MNEPLPRGSETSLVLTHLTQPADANYIAGTKSVEVGVRVEAEDLMTGITTHTNSAYLVFVALSDSGKPIPVPKLVPQTDQQKEWFTEAQERRRKRLAEREPAD